MSAPDREKKPIANTVSVHLAPPEISSEPVTLSVHNLAFESKPQKGKGKKRQEVSDYAIIGFDTEYVVPVDAVSRDEIKEGKAKYVMLSYQFHCLLKTGEAWSGIFIPPTGERMSMAEFVVAALGSRPDQSNQSPLPYNIYLVGHYTKADFPAFSDFKDLSKIAAAVRGSFVSTDSAFKYTVDALGDEKVELNVILRDTFLLAPTGSQSLAALGDILDLRKVLLSDDPSADSEMKGKMDEVRKANWPLFRKYAIQDAVICARYAERILDLCESHLGVRKLPITLTSIGVDLLLKTWSDHSRDPNALLGREVVKEKRWNKRQGHYQTENREVDQLNYALYETLATECYHGGRNEQYWFGPAFSDQWTDYDLSSAYATGMAPIGTPDWTRFDFTTDVTRYTLSSLGYALVDFSFPTNVRFPCLPIRTDNGLVFPLKGQSFCAAPEIAVARALGAEITIKQGIVVASDNSNPVFADYIKHCITERRKYPKKSLDDLFWKELSNSTYGKTAQGLREKRVYDSREMDTVPLPPSKITNPYFAAYITSFVRAVIGEILNALPDRTCVFSCTTDGFLTNAAPNDIAKAVIGPTATAYAKARVALTGEPTVLEIKHQVRNPLGWRTRGQATLVAGEVDPPANIILAKGGLRLADKFETTEQRNAEIVRMFFDRTPKDRLVFESLTGIRDIIEFDADLVKKEISRRVNMEFDWKRKPDLLFDSNTYRHCAFSTRPWETVDQFMMIRALFEKYLDSKPHCIKTVGDFDSFSVYVDANLQLPEEERRYLSRRSGDLKRLRMALCAAWHAGLLGVKSNDAIVTAEQFAEALNACGVPCSRANVENGRKQTFASQSVPATESVLGAILRLREIFPEVTQETLCALHRHETTIKPSRRPYAELKPRGGAYYAGFDIPGVGWIVPGLETDEKMKTIFEDPDYIEPKRDWLAYENYKPHFQKI
jgi:hypothetical protein